MPPVHAPLLTPKVAVGTSLKVSLPSGHAASDLYVCRRVDGLVHAGLARGVGELVDQGAVGRVDLDRVAAAAQPGPWTEKTPYPPAGIVVARAPST